jgi:hypothetical protein
MKSRGSLLNTSYLHGKVINIILNQILGEMQKKQKKTLLRLNIAHSVDQIEKNQRAKSGEGNYITFDIYNYRMLLYYSI